MAMMKMQFKGDQYKMHFFFFLEEKNERWCRIKRAKSYMLVLANYTLHVQLKLLSLTGAL